MLMLTPLVRLPMVSLRLMPMPLVTPTMLESSLELDTLAMEDTLDMVLLVTVATLAMVVSMVDMVVPMVDTHSMVKQVCFQKPELLNYCYCLF